MRLYEDSAYIVQNLYFHHWVKVLGVDVNKYYYFDNVTESNQPIQHSEIHLHSLLDVLFFDPKRCLQHRLQ